MNIYLVNRSTVLRDDDVAALHAPLIVYSRHVRKWWGSMQPGFFFGEPPVANAWTIVFADDSDQAGALGYHDVTPDGRPRSFVFAKTDLDNGYDWQITATHEVAEMLMDPFIARCEQTGDDRFHALELCDPVEADDLGYEITAGGVTMRASDFVTPYWFSGLPGQYDHLGHVKAPLEVLPGGYAYVYEGGQWYAEDHAGKRLTPEEFAKVEPGKTRLAMYARARGRS